ncbi:MAG: hypothetical protein NTY23_13280 [Chloroflexi bacterium]|nr:hypothetical protein [Chloroflexota bacterium]
MKAATHSAAARTLRIPLWLAVVLPLAALAAVLVWLGGGGLLSSLRSDVPPVESLSLRAVHLNRDGFKFMVFNAAAQPVTLAQMTVDDAYWQFHVHPSRILPRFGRAPA